MRFTPSSETNEQYDRNDNSKLSIDYPRLVLIMIISHSHKFIFIKSEKTAGTSVEAVLSAHCRDNDIVVPINDYRHNRNEKGEFIHRAMNADEEYRRIGQHVDAKTIQRKVPAEVWNSYFKFSIIRDPWDRTVSDFFWKRRTDPSIKPRKRFYHYLGVPFNELAPIKKAFAEFIVSDEFVNNDRFYIIDDQLCVDFVIRYENLLEDISTVCKKLGLPAIDLPNLKTGFRRKHHHYSEYFDENSKAIVAEKHRNDIRLFGYKFVRV